MQDQAARTIDRINARNKSVRINGDDYSVRFCVMDETNLSDAIDLGATGFPGEVEAIAKGMRSILSPKNEWTFPGAESVEEGFLLCFIMKLVPENAFSNEPEFPIGITGLYKLVNQPDESWMGWTTLIPQARGLRLGSDLIECFEVAAAEDPVCKAVRAWSVENELRFGGQHKNLTERHGYTMELFGGEEHGAGKYGIYSKGIKGNQTVETCPIAAEMAGGTDAPIPDTPSLMLLLGAFQRQAKQRKLCPSSLMEPGTFSQSVLKKSFGEALDIISAADVLPSLHPADTKILAALVQYSQEVSPNFNEPVKNIVQAYDAQIHTLIAPYGRDGTYISSMASAFGSSLNKQSRGSPGPY